MTISYDPRAWYWRAEDGRVWSSAVGGPVGPFDAAFGAWVAAGGVPTVWPRDEAGSQTDAALRAVLAAAGALVDLTAYAAAARYRAEVAGVATPKGVVATDDRAKVMILGALMAAQAEPAWTTVWQFADGASATLDAAGIAAVAAAVQAHVNGVFATYAAVITKITANPPSITTTAAIDAAFAA